VYAKLFTSNGELTPKVLSNRLYSNPSPQKNRVNDYIYPLLASTAPAAATAADS